MMDDYYNDIRKLQSLLAQDAERMKGAIDKLDDAMLKGATGTEILYLLEGALFEISVELACGQRKTRSLLKKVRKQTRKLLR